jgi:hypothetical protein
VTYNIVAFVKYPTVLCGDFNCDLLQPNGTAQRRYLDFIRDTDLQQLVSQPTRLSKCADGKSTQTLIDLVLCNDPVFIHQCIVSDDAVADHQCVLTELKFACERKSQNSGIAVRNYNRINEDNFAVDLLLQPFDAIFVENDLDRKVDIFNSLFKAVLDKHCPKRPLISRRKPFWDKDLDFACRTRRKWFRAYKASLQTEDYIMHKLYDFYGKKLLKLKELDFIKLHLREAKR